MRRDRTDARQAPLAVVLTQHRQQCLFALLLMFVLSSTSGIKSQFLPVFLVGQLLFDESLVFTANTIGVVAFLVGILFWGILRDRIGWSTTFACGSATGATACLWFFAFISTLASTDNRLILAFVVAGLASGSMHAMLPGLTAALSPTPIRQSGFAFPYSISTALFTGLTLLTLA